MPSIEQKNIIDAVLNGHSVIVNAVAGSGKTTTVLTMADALAENMPEIKCMQITYNKQLKFEVRDKARSRGLKNLTVHTYHSLAVNHYCSRAYDDVGLARALREKTTVAQSPWGDDFDDTIETTSAPTYHVLIIDETQDMTLLYYQLVRKFARESGVRSVVLLGDEYQSVYDFKQADKRFLTMGEQMWPEYKFMRLPLNVSYRVTSEIASYINKTMLGYDRIRTVRNGARVSHICGNIWNMHEKIMSYLRPGFASKTFSPGDVFILATSVRNPRMPIRQLEHALVGAGIPCYMPGSDDSNLDSSVIDGKVVFTTFHQSKGRERDIVVVYGLDDGYCQYFMNGTSANTDCPSMFYVAVTRARKKLIIVEGRGGDPQSAPFMKMTTDEIGKLPFVNLVRIPDGEDRFQPPISRRNVTDLVKFLDDSKSVEIEAIVNRLFVCECPATEVIDIACHVNEETGPEEVADINGIVIPMMFERRVHGTSTVERHLASTADGHYAKIRDEIAESIGVDGIKDATWALRTGVLYASFRANVHFRLAQITKYDWLTMDKIDMCIAVLDKHISKDAVFERSVEKCVNASTLVKGIVDCVDGDTVWEFKCVTELTIEHKMQLALYSILYPEADTMKFKLMNLRTGEILSMVSEGRHGLCERILQILLDRNNTEIIDDDEFVQRSVC